jgi:hypothetical protein
MGGTSIRWRRAITLTGLLSLPGGLLGGAAAPAEAATPPPARFPATPIIDNPLFPLQPGTTDTYDGTTGKRPEHEVLNVSFKIKLIEGIECVQVLDQNFVRGHLVESTLDWYAQDFGGTVWYMGEFATQYKDGQPVGHEGSWVAGKHGAKAGIIMEASPRVGDTYRQEFSEGIAEDMAKVLRVDASVETPFGTWIGNVLLTKDYTQLDSGVEHKYYVPGVGLVKSLDVKGGEEVLELTGIQH